MHFIGRCVFCSKKILHRLEWIKVRQTTVEWRSRSVLVVNVVPHWIQRRLGMRSEQRWSVGRDLMVAVEVVEVGSIGAEFAEARCRKNVAKIRCKQGLELSPASNSTFNLENCHKLVYTQKKTCMRENKGQSCWWRMQARLTHWLRGKVMVMISG